VSRIPGWMKCMSHPLTYDPALSRAGLLVELPAGEVLSGLGT
jgi:hypothetical protein